MEPLKFEPWLKFKPRLKFFKFGLGSDKGIKLDFIDINLDYSYCKLIFDMFKFEKLTTLIIFLPIVFSF